MLTGSSLNKEQKAAVVFGKGPLLVVAGAGTGKTTVITSRIAYLISSKTAKPGEILALTFTDKAANEMESRVDQMVPYGYIDVSISTFHSFGDRILRDYAIDLGLRPDYKVLSYAEQIVFFREHLHLFPLKHYRSLSDPTKNIEALLKVISRAQDEDISPEEYIKGEVGKIYKKYQELKAKKGFVDFGDQVSLTLQLFRENPKILETFRKRYKFILVDEFQDTNYAQFELLRLLAGKEQNITVVGDDDQSIYKFRGAAISNILNFEKTFKKTKKVVLNRNYRSTQLILDSAYRLIKHNDPDRLDKKLIAEKGEGEKKVEHRQFDRVSSEADWIAKTISESGRSLRDFVILTRANADAEPFRQSLNMLSIPYNFSGGGGLYVFPEVKLVVSFLRVIGDLADNVSLFEFSLSQIYRLDPLDMQKINTFAKRRNYTIHYVFAHIDEAEKKDSEFYVLNDVREGSVGAIKRIIADVEYYLDFAKNHSTGEVLYHFLKRSGYLGSLTQDESLENEGKLKNLAAFFEKVRKFKDIAEEDRVAEFIKYLNILKESGENPEAAQPDIDMDAVNIMTVHKAKGLEFPVVFMTSLVSEKFPIRARRDPIELPVELLKEELPIRAVWPAEDFHLQEERRLFFVGMTRARDELYLTSSVDYGGKRERKVSQFVLEALDLPKADIKTLKKKPIDQIALFAPQEINFPPAKKIGPNEILCLSYYPIDDYLTCPLKYKYVHVLNVPLLPSHTIMYGSALHKAVQAYFTARMNKQKFSKKDLIDIFRNNWSSEGFISRQHEEARLSSGLKALERFYAGQKRSKLKVRFVEEEFKIVKDNIQVKGRWDLVVEDKVKVKNEGKVRIVDFKSTEVKSQEDADKRTKENNQLSVYALAWKEMFGAMPDRLQLYFLDSGLIGSAEKTEKDLDKIWEKIKTVAASIRQADYHATPAKIKCGYCPYNEICPSSVV